MTIPQNKIKSFKFGGKKKKTTNVSCQSTHWPGQNLIGKKGKPYLHLLPLNEVKTQSEPAPLKQRGVGVFLFAFIKCCCCCLACGILVPQPQMELRPRKWNCPVLSTGPPGYSPGCGVFKGWSALVEKYETLCRVVIDHLGLVCY